LKSFKDLMTDVINQNNTASTGQNQEKVYNRTQNCAYRDIKPLDLPDLPDFVQNSINRRKEERERKHQEEKRLQVPKPKPNAPKQKWPPKSPLSGFIPLQQYESAYKKNQAFISGAQEMDHGTLRVMNYLLQLDKAFKSVYVSQAMIAAGTNLSDRHVRRILTALRNRQYISYDQHPDKPTLEYHISPVWKLPIVQNSLYQKFSALTYVFQKLYKPILLALLFSASHIQDFKASQGPLVEVPTSLKRILYPALPTKMSYKSKDVYIKQQSKTPPPQRRTLEGAPEGVNSDFNQSYSLTNHSTTTNRPGQLTSLAAVASQFVQAAQSSGIHVQPDSHTAAPTKPRPVITAREVQDEAALAQCSQIDAYNRLLRRKTLEIERAYSPKSDISPQLGSAGITPTVPESQQKPTPPPPKQDNSFMDSMADILAQAHANVTARYQAQQNTLQKSSTKDEK
jgi:hypothetical protein